MTVKAVVFDLDDTLYSSKDFYYKVYGCIQSMYNINKEDVLNFLIKHYKNKTIKNLINNILKCDVKLDLIKHARDLLECLKNKQYKVGLITNGIPSIQKIKLKKLGIYDIFDSIVYAVELKAMKPSHIPYLKSIEELNVLPSESFYIGDDPNIDFCGARRIGMHTIRIKYGVYKNSPSNKCVDYEINSYKALLKYFKC